MASPGTSQSRIPLLIYLSRLSLIKDGAWANEAKGRNSRVNPKILFMSIWMRRQNTKKTMVISFPGKGYGIGLCLTYRSINHDFASGKWPGTYGIKFLVDCSIKI